MNPKLRKLLIAIGVLTVVVIAIILIPRTVSLYLQIKGGQSIEYVLRFEEGINELLCEKLPPSNETNRQEVKTAFTDLNHAISLNRDNAQAYFYLGKANCLLGNPAKAVENYEQYTQIRSNNPLGYIGLGFAYEQLGDASAAGGAWKLAKLSVDDFNQAGNEEFKAENYYNAIAWYERGLLVDPKSAEAWLNIGEVYDAMQDYEMALVAYRQAWENDPELSTAALVESYKRNGDINSVKNVLKIMLEKYLDSYDRLLWFQELGSSYLSHGDYDQAVELYSQAIREYPEQPEFHISLGWAFYERGDGVEAARNELEFAIALNDEAGSAYYAVGQLLNREEKFTEAKSWLQRASELEPDNKWYAIVYGNSARSAGDLEEAINIYENVISRNPNYDQAYLEIAVVYYMLEQYEEAKSAIEKAISLASSPDEWYFVRAGTIFENAGEIEIAKQYFHQALAINPTNSSAINGLSRIESK